MCSTVRHDRSETYTAHCRVDHSINTVPTFSCPLQSSKSSVQSEMKQLHVSQCAYDSIVYNETTFTINITDIVNPMTCIVRYSAVGNTSVSYAEEEFVVYRDMKKTCDRDNSSTNDLEGEYDILADHTGTQNDRLLA